jgi:HSP20 family protein
MSNLTRTDPFQLLTRYDPFGGAPAWPSLAKFFEQLPAEPAIRLDVTEDDKAYRVKADLPGVKKDDIAVEVEGNQVSITAEVKRDKEEKQDEKVVASERYFGRQFRSFTFARDIERDKVEAKFADGVLELTLPKNGGARPARIAIR